MHSPVGVAVIVGPTASGKTALAVELALAFGAEVVSADSMQVYRGMDIGTAKPSQKERRGVIHHMLDVAEPCESFSVARYTAMAGECIRGIRRRGRLPILAGGTGLYLDALVSGLRFGDIPSSPEYRAELHDLARSHGPQRLRAMLEECDAESASRIHPNDIKRTIRALEVFHATGVTISEWRRRSKSAPSPYRPVYIGLCFEDRAELYRRIDARVEKMLSDGLLDEVRRLMALPGVARGTAMQAIGYKELAEYLRGECGLEEAVSRVKRETRRYAKRQMTWLRRNPDINWFKVDLQGIQNIYSISKKLLESTPFLW